jgi:hypothetical protein
MPTSTESPLKNPALCLRRQILRRRGGIARPEEIESALRFSCSSDRREEKTVDVADGERSSRVRSAPILCLTSFAAHQHPR